MSCSHDQIDFQLNKVTSIKVEKRYSISLNSAFLTFFTFPNNVNVM